MQPATELFSLSARAAHRYQMSSRSIPFQAYPLWAFLFALAADICNPHLLGLDRAPLVRFKSSSPSPVLSTAQANSEQPLLKIIRVQLLLQILMGRIRLSLVVEVYCRCTSVSISLSLETWSLIIDTVMFQHHFLCIVGR